MDRLNNKKNNLLQQKQIIDSKLLALDEEINALHTAFNNRNQLVKKIYEIANEEYIDEINVASILGGHYFDYDDSRKHFDYEVCFDYVIDNKIYCCNIRDKAVYRFYVKDINKQEETVYCALDPNNINHQPAYLFWSKVLKFDAKNYMDLDKNYFPVGDASWSGSGLKL